MLTAAIHAYATCRDLDLCWSLVPSSHCVSYATVSRAVICRPFVLGSLVVRGLVSFCPAVSLSSVLFWKLAAVRAITDQILMLAYGYPCLSIVRCIVCDRLVRPPHRVSCATVSRALNLAS
jgi:hypothetical protein